MKRRPEEITEADLRAGERKHPSDACPVCGYCQEGLELTAACPECGFPACLKCEPGKLLRHADKDWLRRVRQGLLLHQVAGVMVVVPWVLFLFVMMMDDGGAPSVAARESRAFAVASTVAGACVALRGVFLISRPDPTGVFLGNQTIERRMLMPVGAVALGWFAATIMLSYIGSERVAAYSLVFSTFLLILLCGSELIRVAKHARLLHWQTSSWTLDFSQSHKSTIRALYVIAWVVAALDFMLKLFASFRLGPGDLDLYSCCIQGFPILWACVGFGDVRAAIAHEIDAANAPVPQNELGTAPGALLGAVDEAKPP